MAAKSLLNKARLIKSCEEDTGYAHGGYNVTHLKELVREYRTVPTGAKREDLLDILCVKYGIRSAGAAAKSPAKSKPAAKSPAKSKPAKPEPHMYIYTKPATAKPKKYPMVSDSRYRSEPEIEEPVVVPGYRAPTIDEVKAAAKKQYPKDPKLQEEYVNDWITVLLPHAGKGGPPEELAKSIRAKRDKIDEQCTLCRKHIKARAALRYDQWTNLHTVCSNCHDLIRDLYASSPDKSDYIHTSKGKNPQSATDIVTHGAEVPVIANLRSVRSL
jgi:hypothetical protein